MALFSIAPALAAPNVIASIVPVHALVAGVMLGVAEPELLLSGQTSEHQASFSPEQLKHLGEADLVFMIGHGLELKLDELSGSEAVNGKRFVALSTLEGLTKFPIREGGVWEAHDGEDTHGHENEKAFDPHLWLDPENAKVMVAAIAAELSKTDPANAQHYADNAGVVTADLAALSDEIAFDLSAVKDKPFVVFHDAYQYFERRFGLAAAGSISDITATAPSAKRLRQVRQNLKDVGAACVFHEPQFSDAAANIVIEGTGAKAGVLDPIGATLAPGRSAYRQLLVNLAAGLKACLSSS